MACNTFSPLYSLVNGGGSCDGSSVDMCSPTLLPTHEYLRLLSRCAHITHTPTLAMGLRLMPFGLAATHTSVHALPSSSSSARALTQEG